LTISLVEAVFVTVAGGFEFGSRDVAAGLI